MVKVSKPTGRPRVSQPITRRRLLGGALAVGLSAVGGRLARAVEGHDDLPYRTVLPNLASDAPRPPHVRRWSAVGNMTVGRSDHTSTLLFNGKVLVAGLSATADLYDPATRQFTRAAAPPTAPGFYATATRLLDGRVLLLGGNTTPDTALLYSPQTDVWNPTGALELPRRSHTASLLHNGIVLVAGGMAGDPAASVAHAEVFDPASGEFAQVGALQGDRLGHTASELADGRVLIVGGVRTTGPGTGLGLSSAELFDPATNTFSPAPSLSWPRAGHTATVLLSGDVLIAGGADGETETEIYDVASGRFVRAGRMTVSRGSHTASLLPTGEVLLTGGYTTVGPVTTASTELYNATTRTFTAAEPMTIARQEHRASVLSNGDVLVTGSRVPFYLPLAELYW